MKSGQEQIQKICEVLRKETLEPAELEAQSLIESAKKKAELIINKAEEEALAIIKKAKEEIHKEQKVFQASLSQSATQTLETLRHEIENNLFDPELEKQIHLEMAKPETIAELIKAVINAIEKEGLAADLEVIIPKLIPAKEVSSFLSDSLFTRLKNKEFTLGDFSGGAKVRIGHKNMTIEVTDSVIKNLVAAYVKSDFRNYIFKSV